MLTLIECPRRRRRWGKFLGTRILVWCAVSLGLWVVIGCGLWRFL